MAILNNSNAISSGGYDITNSLRFRSSASAYLSRTPASAGNRQIFTVSAWVKRGTLGVDQKIFSAYGGTSDDSGVFDVRFSSADVLYIGDWNTGLTTTAVFRDPSAWYHIVIAVDTTQATGTNRIKAYVNGVQYTLSGTAFVQNVTTPWNNNVAQNIGRNATASNTYFDGYMAEFYNIDGQALTPSSFGETDTTTGSWKPKAYTGTYGTNGFYLKFSDIATTSGSNAGLGKDFSGNANYWTTNNISVTAGTTYDAMIDSPTLTSATVANYATLNPLDKNFGNAGSIVDGNLGTTSQTSTTPSTFYLSTGKWYFEASFSSITGVSSLVEVGIRNGTSATGQIQGYKSDGNKDVETTATAYGSTYTTSDIIGCAFDLDAKSMTFYKNGTSQGSFTYTTADLYTPCLIARGTTTFTGTINFGQRPFSYTPPSGYVRINTYNLPTSTIVKGNKYMDIVTYTGTASTLTIPTNINPSTNSMMWFKSRSGTPTNPNHYVVDSLRTSSGTPYWQGLIANGTAAEAGTGDVVQSYTSSSITKASGSIPLTNENGIAYVGWLWQAGSSAASSNTNGSITSTVSVNATAGFSVVTYTGTGANATVGHGLGVAPKFIVIKRRNGVSDWICWHTSISQSSNYAIDLDRTAAAYNTYPMWNTTSPTSSVFNLGTDPGVNGSTNTYVAYCWAEIAGFSKFGSYTGNGSDDGSFVYTGFRPKFILTKGSSAVTDWVIHDTSRNTYNVANLSLYPNTSGAETTSEPFDILSNGFKLRTTAGNVNNSGTTYIYMAFAESPFKNSLAR